MPRTTTTITAAAAAAAILTAGAATAANAATTPTTPTTRPGYMVDPGPHKPNKKIKLRKPVYRWTVVDKDHCSKRRGDLALNADLVLWQRVTPHGVQRKAVMTYTDATAIGVGGIGIITWPYKINLVRTYPANGHWNSRTEIAEKGSKKGGDGHIEFNSIDKSRPVKVSGTVEWRMHMTANPHDAKAVCKVDVYGAPYKKR